MNKIFLCGRITADPEIKTTSGGVEFCNFTVACDRGFKDGSGNRQSDFIPVTAWRKSAAFLHTYFKKGDGILVEGSLESRKYVDKDGNNRTAYSVTADHLEFPPSRRRDSQDGPSNTAPDAGFVDVSPEEAGDLPF